MLNKSLPCACFVHPYCVFMDVCCVPLLCCLPICVCVCLRVQVPLRQCRSIRSGFCRLPLYCAPLVCVPAVIEVLAVWWHNKPKTTNHRNVVIVIIIISIIIPKSNTATINLNKYTISIQHSCAQNPFREYRSIRSGASGLPCYCAPLVCVPAVTGGLAVYRHNKLKTI